MLIDVTCKIDTKIDIDEAEAFRILCKTLDMEFVLNDDIEFYVKKDEEYEELKVCYKENGHEKVYDERGELFVALRNVAVNIFPNRSFRGDEYIYTVD